MDERRHDLFGKGQRERRVRIIAGRAILEGGRNSCDLRLDLLCDQGLDLGQDLAHGGAQGADVESVLPP